MLLRQISKMEFIKEFKNSGNYNLNFSYEGLDALYDYLEECSEVEEKDMKYDIIEICCNFTEYKDLEELNYYNDNKFENLEELEEETIVIRIPDSDSFIIQDF